MNRKFFKIEDVHILQGEKAKCVKVEIEEAINCIEVKPEGYGDLASADGHGVPIILEVIGGRLRLVVFPDINKDDATVIDMEGAREAARTKRVRVIESDSLPFFGEDHVNIFDRATGKSMNVKFENFKDITTDGGRMHDIFKYQITEED